MRGIGSTKTKPSRPFVSKAEIRRDEQKRRLPQIPVLSDEEIRGLMCKPSILDRSRYGLPTLQVLSRFPGGLPWSVLVRALGCGKGFGGRDFFLRELEQEGYLAIRKGRGPVRKIVCNWVTITKKGLETAKKTR